jgi:hypothetical protein
MAVQARSRLRAAAALVKATQVLLVEPAGLAGVGGRQVATDKLHNLPAVLGAQQVQPYQVTVTSHGWQQEPV